MFKVIVKDADDDKILAVVNSATRALYATKVYERAGYKVVYRLVNASEKNIYNMRKLGLEV